MSCTSSGHRRAAAESHKPRDHRRTAPPHARPDPGTRKRTPSSQTRAGANEEKCQTQGQSSGPSTPPSLRRASAAAHAQGAAEARSASHPAPTSGNRAAAGLHRARRCVAGVLRPRSQQRCAMGQKRSAAQAGLGQTQRNRARVPPSTNTLKRGAPRARHRLGAFMAR